MRLIIPHTMPANVVGELAYMLSSISTLVVFFLINSLLFYFFNKNNN